jgi:hypothetical protein
MEFAAATIVDDPPAADSQIGRILDTMLCKRKAVYIGIVPSVSGMVIAVSPRNTVGSTGSTGHSVSPRQVNAASPGELSCALCW